MAKAAAPDGKHGKGQDVDQGDKSGQANRRRRKQEADQFVAGDEANEVARRFRKNGRNKEND